jgi:hypothetical protein
MSEPIKDVHAYGVVTPAGGLLPATGNEPDALFAVLAYMLGVDSQHMQDTLVAKGYRVVPVTIQAQTSTALDVTREAP